MVKSLCFCCIWHNGVIEKKMNCNISLFPLTIKYIICCQKRYESQSSLQLLNHFCIYYFHYYDIFFIVMMDIWYSKLSGIVSQWLCFSSIWVNVHDYVFKKLDKKGMGRSRFVHFMYHEVSEYSCTLVMFLPNRRKSVFGYLVWVTNLLHKNTWIGTKLIYSPKTLFNTTI